MNDLQEWLRRITKDRQDIPKLTLTVGDKHYALGGVTAIGTAIGPCSQAEHNHDVEWITLEYHVGHETGQTAEQKDAEALQAKIERAGDSDDPRRPRIVVKIGDEYYATHRWEVNPNNGWATIQLRDGSVFPTQPKDWEVWILAPDEFGIERSEIIVDDSDRG